MFYGREHELNILDRMYSSNKFEMAVIYGRRRVGKTTLINEFIKDKSTIFFSAMEINKTENLHLLSQSIHAHLRPDSLSAPNYVSFADAFREIGQLAKTNRLIFVIDEYPYLAAADRSISSLLQNMIDHDFKETQLFIILCGSSMSFMENQVLGYQSPLYGRRTAQFHIIPFDYRMTGEMMGGYSNEDKALVYGVTGGVPLYTEQFQTALSVDDNILATVFEKNAILYDEPSNLLKQELRDPQVYNSIIAAIANGASRMKDIKTKLDQGRDSVTSYLNNLISLGIIRRITPVTEKESSNKSIYRLDDMLFRFWYRFVPSNAGNIATGRIAKSYARTVKPFLTDYMGAVFERMCMDYLLYYADLPIDIGEYGEWWGTNPNTHKEEQIDIMIISSDKRTAVFGECKYRNELVGKGVLDTLKTRASLFGRYEKKIYYIFSKKGFTNGLLTETDENLKLITLDEMY